MTILQNGRFGREIGWLGIVLLMVGLVGCDLVEPVEETVVLQEGEVDFRFEFTADELSTNETTTIQSVNTVEVNLDSLLNARGFALKDLRSVQIEEAMLFMRFPLNQELGFLERVRLQINAQELSPLIAAEHSQFPSNGQTVSFSTASDRDLTAYVQKPLQASLLLDTSRPLDEQDGYVMEAELELKLEVGGF